MQRDAALKQLKDHTTAFDVVIIGGGASGLGCAVDAASRGYSVALIEQADFAKATSSRSTKLIHGGVRYLKQGNLSLVRRALKERARLCDNAPHLVRHLSFIVPIYRWWEGPFYQIGLKVYDLLAGKLGFEPSKRLSKRVTLERIPTLQAHGLRGGVIYSDAQFDDARLAINLAQSVFDLGGLAINYVQAIGFEKHNARIHAVHCEDRESGETFSLPGRAFINATGVFSDGLRQLDQPQAPPMITASRGVHLVVPKHFVPGLSALMVPKTSDGRVLFAVPWHQHVVVGTTDTPTQRLELEPQALEEDIDFILANAAQFLDPAPKRADVLSVFAGLRPLVQLKDSGGNTAACSRDHTITISDSGLLTLAGGKWTTYRHMAQDAIDHAQASAGLDPRPCPTAHLPIHGACHDPAPGHPRMARYGSDAPAILALAQETPELAQPIHPALPDTRAEALWSIRHEMARRVEDILSRRTRMLELNAQAAHDSAEIIAEIIAKELGHSPDWAKQEAAAFQALAQPYILT